MIRRFIILSLLVLGLAGLVGMQPAFAADILNGDGVDGAKGLCSGDAANSTVCQDKTTKNPLTGSDGLLVRITTVIAFVAGAAAVIVLIVGSIRFITSGGDSAKVANARSAILNAAIGLIVVILARTLIVYVLNRLG